jgi:Tol biopolymer transport system component
LRPSALASHGPNLSLYSRREADYGRGMNLTSTNLSPARMPWATAIALTIIAVFGAAPAQAAFPGVPGQIVYSKNVSSEEGTTGGLVTHSPRRQGGSHPITDDIDDESPSFSADGRTIAFSGNRELPAPGNYAIHIYVMNADGSGVRALTSGASFDRNPSFSPNGQQVVFDRSTLLDPRPQIFIVNIDGTGLRQLTEGSKNYDPVFAPSGKWIAFVSDRDHDVKTDRSDILSMRADGTKQKVLIDGPYNESEPDISPDGRKVAFVSNRRQGSHIYVAKSNGRGVRALTQGHDSCHYTACFFNPAWAPDGKHIALLSLRRYSSDVEVMRSNGTQRREFASGGTESEGYGTYIGAPTWGPQPR